MSRITDGTNRAIIQDYVDELYEACKAVNKKYNALLGGNVVSYDLTKVDAAIVKEVFRPNGVFIVWMGDVDNSGIGIAQAETIGHFSPRAIADAVANTIIEAVKKQRREGWR